MTRPRPSEVRISGAAENNLRDLDVSFSRGINAVVGVSGSGKSSLVFDTLYHEARRRFLDTLSVGSASLRAEPARVRAIDGLGPSVALAQDVLNRDPNSTLATAAGIHPFLRVLYARFAVRHCLGCGTTITSASTDLQLATLRTLVQRAGGPVELTVPLVPRAEGSHARLLAWLADRWPAGSIEVDGSVWRGRRLDPDREHRIAVRLATVVPGTTSSELRALLRSAAALGATSVTANADGTSHTLSHAPVCPGCGRRLPELEPEDFRSGHPATAGYELDGRPLGGFLGLDVAAAAAAMDELGLPAEAKAVGEHIRRRLAALDDMGLGYLTLDRPSPTLSRGEAQRVRLAVILANRIEDMLHILDEPSIGLDPVQVVRLVRRLGRVRGPVVMVEHDRWAVGDADRIVELGPGAGRDGGRVIFEGTPARLWGAETPSGRWFSGAATAERVARRPEAAEHVIIRGASLRTLDGSDFPLPVGRLSVVTGPSGAGKTTLVRDVLGASMAAGTPVGCAALDGPRLRPVAISQDPIGRNPRSNPATYTGLAERIRALFARGTGRPGSLFTFNRPEGACPECDGMGALEVRLAYLASEWVRCERCQGRRFNEDALEATVRLADDDPRNIADVFELRVDEAASLFEGDRASRTIVAALRDVGLGYLPLGQPSTSLSGGEAQRVKLAKWLATARAGDLVTLDEPTTGLHPADLARLVAVLRRLTDAGSTVVVVEHHPDVVAAADWIIRLGPGSGPDGGRLLYAGPLAGRASRPPSIRPRADPRAVRRTLDEIRIRGAAANNLARVSLAIPKDAITAVIGVSGSGKSSLLRDVLEAEASRRLVECLSMYERQSVKEGPEAPVASLEGLGPTVAIGPDRLQRDPRGTVGSATDVSFHLSVLLAYAGTRRCPVCGGAQRRTSAAATAAWVCETCGTEGPAVSPADFSPSAYAAACLTCHGLGTVSEPRLERLIVRPDAPICAGAMHSPGYYPQGYLCTPPSLGYWMLQALGERYGFDPFETPWRELTEEARQAFLFAVEGVEIAPSDGRKRRTLTWRGFFDIVGSWDLGGMYVEHVACPSCRGRRLRPASLEVRLAGMDRHELHTAPIVTLARLLERVEVPSGVPGWVENARSVAARRTSFLVRVGLGYLELDRLSRTLSAGEAQRVRLASLLGAELTGMTVLLDEPTRGLHPRETAALADALGELRDGGNTVVLVDHDPLLLRHADHLVLLGPGAGRHGGRVVAAGPARSVLGTGSTTATRDLVEPPLPARVRGPRRTPSGWMTIRGATHNNLSGEDVRIPLGVLVGMCGVSGSGKSTLAIDVLARALAPARLTTSVAYEDVAPGAHEAIDGAPPRTVHSDQARSGIRAPGAFLGVMAPLRRAYAGTAEAATRGLEEADLAPRCDACRGRGSTREDMGFLPDLERPCDACGGTGYRPEVQDLVVRGRSLPAFERLTLDEVIEAWGDVDAIARPLRVATSLGLGYLVLGQPSRSLSGGEAQRLKLSRELARATKRDTLYILDEPTVGLHGSDVARLADVLDGLVTQGHTVLVVEHDPALLSCCDALIELGPGGGPDGGRVVATGRPEELAARGTPTAPYLKAVLS